MSDKTEAPTPRRLRRARQEGDSPVSASLTQAFVFVVVLALLPSAFRMIVERVTSRLHEALSFQLADFSPVSLVLDVALLSLPLIVAGAVTAGAVGVAQTGGSVAFKKLAPDLNRANPISGLKNLVRVDRLVALARSLAGTLLAGSIPGVSLGTWMAPRAPVRVLRAGLASLLLITGLSTWGRVLALIWKSPLLSGRPQGLVADHRVCNCFCDSVGVVEADPAGAIGLSDMHWAGEF